MDTSYLSPRVDTYVPASLLPKCQRILLISYSNADMAASVSLYHCIIAVMLCCVTLIVMEQSHVDWCCWTSRWGRGNKICDVVFICCWCSNGRLISDVICITLSLFALQLRSIKKPRESKRNLIWCSPVSVTVSKTLKFIGIALILTHCELATLLIQCGPHGVQSCSLLVFWYLNKCLRY